MNRARVHSSASPSTQLIPCQYTYTDRVTNTRLSTFERPLSSPTPEIMPDLYSYRPPVKSATLPVPSYYRVRHAPIINRVLLVERECLRTPSLRGGRETARIAKFAKFISF
ncbi:hypothetical protein PUN28_010070 [Cardiocondyla obscurior]|uniref:Uncharacterized protein n=1 Tax=Cardiocondyla obscurior TaxID=286306 RepID=A0AAW2FS24_9HYME